MIPNYFKTEASKLVAIVVPVSNRLELTPEEKISLKQLIHYLGSYDKFIVAPKNLSVNFPGFGLKRFSEKYFGSVKAHDRLTLSPKFYKSFGDYKFILIYHLDSLVFSDQLMKWCKMNYDFIGAPWIEHKEAKYHGNPTYEGKVGNGGFTLMKIESILKVCYSKKLCREPNEYRNDIYISKLNYKNILLSAKSILKRFGIRNNVRCEMLNYKNNSDAFFANRAVYYYPGFRIPEVDIALKFAFESVPKYCFEKNNFKLPFGCHAWHRYDRAFWEPYLIN